MKVTKSKIIISSCIAASLIAVPIYYSSHSHADEIVSHEHLLDRNPEIVKIDGPAEVEVDIDGPFPLHLFDGVVKRVGENDQILTVNVKSGFDSSERGEQTVKIYTEYEGETVERNIVTQIKNLSKPEIKHQGDIQVDVSSEADLLADLQVLDKVDGDISDKVKVEHNIDWNTPGQYEVTYKIPTDAGEVIEKRKVVVKEKPKPQPVQQASTQPNGPDPKPTNQVVETRSPERVPSQQAVQQNVPHTGFSYNGYNYPLIHTSAMKIPADGNVYAWNQAPGHYLVERGGLASQTIHSLGVGSKVTVNGQTFTIYKVLTGLTNNHETGDLQAGEALYSEGAPLSIQTCETGDEYSTQKMWFGR